MNANTSPTTLAILSKYLSDCGIQELHGNLRNLRMLPPRGDPVNCNAFYAEEQQEAIGGEDQLLGRHYIGRNRVRIAENELDGSQRQKQRDDGCKRRQEKKQSVRQLQSMRRTACMHLLCNLSFRSFTSAQRGGQQGEWVRWSRALQRRKSKVKPVNWDIQNLPKKKMHMARRESRMIGRTQFSMPGCQ